ncbi:hypothetical protein [Skermania piniformis]|uniref:Uncharacterized protein n=1 Tax=Skermania pinensis TaxID=39122 RepID=A0ABX8S980_9ACTN|nr:hypothetical protein [Skermania piniformis]QXQ14424.1 hypothetical protein KV203_03130 [Skermania piniformis]
MLEEALRKLLVEHAGSAAAADFELPSFRPEDPALRPGVDLYDKELMADLLDGDGTR